MATFHFSSEQMRRHLFSLCQKEFEEAKTKIIQEASTRMADEARRIAAQFGMKIQEGRDMMKDTTEVVITFIEPKEKS